MAIRTIWHARSLDIEDEPLLLTLLKYRQKKNRHQVPNFHLRPVYGIDPRHRQANLVSSITTDGRQMPILDLDFPHHFEPSTTPGHHHLYLDIPMSKFKWFCLMTGLALSGVIELHFYAWSLRRGGNFVRIPTSKKLSEAETRHSNYGWIFRVRKPDGEH